MAAYGIPTKPIKIIQELYEDSKVCDINLWTIEYDLIGLIFYQVSNKDVGFLLILVLN